MRGLMTKPDILRFIAEGGLSNARLDEMDGVSIDLHLGDVFMTEQKPENWQDQTISTYKGQKPEFSTKQLKRGETFLLSRGHFCMAQTEERFAMPTDVTGILFMTSKVARAVLNHSLSTLINTNCTSHLVL